MFPLFWSATCPHCLEARPQIQALARTVPPAARMTRNH